MEDAALESISHLVKEKVDPAELRHQEEKYQTRRVLRDGRQPLSKDDEVVYFQYALALVQSPYKSDWPKGRRLLEEIYSESTDSVAKRDYLFYCSVAEVKLKNYKEAHKFAKAILYVEPFNHQAKALEAYITKKEDADFVTGAAVVGGIAVGALAVLGALASKK